MDGCWQPWLQGCRVDWEAWSALGTFAAVLVALGVAFSESQYRRISERQEARIIAAMLGHEFLAKAASLSGIFHDMGAAEPHRPVFAAAMGEDRRFRQMALQKMRSASILPRTEAALPRLHILPNTVAAEVLHAVQTTKLLTLGTIPYGQAVDRHDSEDALTRTAELFDALSHAINAVMVAADVCNALGDEVGPSLCEEDED